MSSNVCSSDFDSLFTFVLLLVSTSMLFSANRQRLRQVSNQLTRRTYFQVEKCPLCRCAIRLDLSPSLILRDLVEILLVDDIERREIIQRDMQKLQKHKNCIRLGAHCTGTMCLRPKAIGDTMTPTGNAYTANHHTHHALDQPIYPPNVTHERSLPLLPPTSET